jgi:hypothetical protein
LTYGRRARLPLSLPVDRYSSFSDRLNYLATALQVAKEVNAKQREYHRAKINERANVKDFQVGDTVIVKADARIPLTAHGDPQYEIYKLRGPVAFLKHQQTGKLRNVNIQKLHLVDPEIIWDEI